VVIDHMARVDLRHGLGSPAVTALRRLLDTGDVWVKVSGADRLATEPPSMADSAALAALLVRSNPERVVWGTDLPHSNTYGFVPDDGDLVDLLAEIAPGPERLRQLLVDKATCRPDGCHSAQCRAPTGREQGRRPAGCRRAHRRQLRLGRSPNPPARGGPSPAWVTGKDPTGRFPGARLAEQAITVSEAIAAYTITRAWADSRMVDEPG
jgi:Amidohydrolase